MEEFVKLTWRKNVTDEDLEGYFLSEEAVSDLNIYKSFDRKIKTAQKKNVKLNLSKEKFVPGLKYHRSIRRKSLLTKSQKSSCLEALKLIQSGKKRDLLTQREKYCLQIYSECQPKILEENRLFLEYIRNVWLKHKDTPLRTKPGILNYAWPRWKRKLKRCLDYPQHYKEFSTLCLNFDENEATVDFQHVVQPLETGTLARFAHPNLKEPCILKLNTLQRIAKEVVSNSKLPVSRDNNVEKLIQNHSFDVVISSSALKQIVDFTNIKCKWLIPVIVKEIDVDKGEGKTMKKKVVFVDKVLAKANPNPTDLNNYTYKRLLKLNFCQYEAFNYPVQETPIEEETEEENSEKKEENDKIEHDNKRRTFHHNVNYRIWNVKKTTTLNTLMKNQIKDREISVLIRCKLDGCEDTDQGVLYPVIVRPKIEQQLQYGVNIPSKSELARDWTSLFFRLYSVLYRARIYSPMNEIISVEKCSLQKINTEAHSHYNYKPILGLGVLEKVLSHLVNLECGSYILQHLPKHESFLSVMKHCGEKTDNVFDLHAECTDVNVDSGTRQNWLPIDVNYILPVHEELKTLPALFHGFDGVKRNGTKYIEDMYNAWRKDPKSVHSSWDSYFRNSQKEIKPAYQPPPISPPPNDSPIHQWSQKKQMSMLAPQRSGDGGASKSTDAQDIRENMTVQNLIRNYQTRGHLVADLDPLGIQDNDIRMGKTYRPRMQNDSEIYEVLKHYNLVNLDKVYQLPRSTFIGGNRTELTLREIVHRLEKTYCRHIGVQFMYIDDAEQRRFIRQRMETPGVLNFSNDAKKLILRRLINTGEFELFLSKKWNSVKRFGLEGCDMFIPMLQHIIDRSTEFGVEHFFMGIAHRGRLNLLANVFKKPLHKIFNQFEPLRPADVGSGDVKYHYGSHTERTSSVSAKKYKLTLLANASHLEAVNACVLGRTRAEQFIRGDDHGKKSMAVLMHGDAAFCGQGVNYEALGLTYLPNYTTNGSICIIINNQIGYTTDPRFSRSSRYCSDLGRVVHAPIFHVNADDPESCILVADIAAAWRATFHRDIVIDVVGYRRYGHNEADEPMFTQPLMYTKISQTKPITEKYAEQLIAEKVVTPTDVETMKKEFRNFCDAEYKKAQEQTQIFIKDWLDSPWDGFYDGKDTLKAKPTGISESTIKHIAEKFSSRPPENLDFVLHKGIARMLDARRTMVQQREIDWCTAEGLAIGSLLKEGISVRLSGQDVERGTFSHRHHVLHHQTRDKVTYEPMSNLYSNQAKYTVSNSSLSEYGVLGFETGYAQADPNLLVLWEAQFGDFANVAQSIFDQYLSGGESKWGRQNGLVILLPHGFEGMGSEHSSGRIERFLQMCADDPENVPPESADYEMKQLRDCNWIIANCSTPANLFHIWRRQIALPFRKPLVLFTPKSLLKLRQCRSRFEDIMEGTGFVRFIPENGPASRDPSNVKKLILCAGKIYYDIITELSAKKVEKDIAVARIEQISPFPYDLIKKEIDKYPNAKLVWAQEEPKNNGAYEYVLHRLNSLLQGARKIHYIGRPTSAVPATGLKMQHMREVEQLKKDFVEI